MRMKDLETGISYLYDDMGFRGLFRVDETCVADPVHPRYGDGTAPLDLVRGRWIRHTQPDVELDTPVVWDPVDLRCEMTADEFDAWLPATQAADQLATPRSEARAGLATLIEAQAAERGLPGVVIGDRTAQVPIEVLAALLGIEPADAALACA